MKLVSPDTGTTSNTYDSGGNLATATDARSAKATYSYDALNRVTQIVYTDQTIHLCLRRGNERQRPINWCFGRESFPLLDLRYPGAG